MTFDVYEPRKQRPFLTGPVDGASTQVEPDTRGSGVPFPGKKEEVFVVETVDMVNHPPHYTSHPSGVEAIEITRHYDFAIGNAIKYLWRAGLKKDPSRDDAAKEIEDLEKAVFYINDKITQLRKRTDA